MEIPSKNRKNETVYTFEIPENTTPVWFGTRMVKPWKEIQITASMIKKHTPAWIRRFTSGDASGIKRMISTLFPKYDPGLVPVPIKAGLQKRVNRS